MSKSFDTFVHNIKKTLEFCELRDFESMTGHQNDDEWKSFSSHRYADKINYDNRFVITRQANPYYFKCLDYLIGQLDKPFSETFYNKLFHEFLEEQKRNNFQLTDSCKKFIDKIHSIREPEYKFLIPISRSQHWKNLNFGKIKIVLLTEEVLKEEFNPSDSRIANCEDLIKTNGTNIFSIVTVNAVDETTAKEIAEGMTERYIYSRKLLDPFTFMRLRKNDLHLINESILMRKDDMFSCDHSNHDIPIGKSQSKQYYEKLKPYEEKLNKFLFNPTTDLHKKILDALYWFGEVDHYKDSNIRKFLSRINGMEIILLNNYTCRKKFKKFGINASLFLYKDDTHGVFYEKNYLKRSTITHKTLESVSDQEVLDQMYDLGEILLALIDLSTKYSDLEGLLKQEFNIINTNTP